MCEICYSDTTHKKTMKYTQYTHSDEMKHIPVAVNKQTRNNSSSAAAAVFVDSDPGIRLLGLV
jgi:uncharacterized RmlC-like cupin family protein